VLQDHEVYYVERNGFFYSHEPALSPMILTTGIPIRNKYDKIGNSHPDTQSTVI
jgi:hypothetical protein